MLIFLIQISICSLLRKTLMLVGNSATLFSAWILLLFRTKLRFQMMEGFKSVKMQYQTLQPVHQHKSCRSRLVSHSMMLTDGMDLIHHTQRRLCLAFALGALVSMMNYSRAILQQVQYWSWKKCFLQWKYLMAHQVACWLMKKEDIVVVNPRLWWSLIQPLQVLIELMDSIK